MASGAYQAGIKDCVGGVIDLTTTTLKILLAKSTYTYDPDHTNVGQVNEITGVSGYTGGFGGAGRKTATLTVTADNANNRVKVVFGNLTWSALGAGDTIGGAILIKETTNDAGSRLIAFFDFTDVATNGSDITLSFDATNGNLLFNC